MGKYRRQIKDLLDRRHAQGPHIDRAERAMADLVSCIDRLSGLTASVLGASDAPADLVQLCHALTDDLTRIKAGLADIHAKLASLAVRFAKSTINIGVAGKARQGKSTLLQAISGLDASVIPANNGMACTGAKSKILHAEDNPRAVIEFHSKEEFLSDIISAYFAELGLQPIPRTVGDFANNRLPVPPSDRPTKQGLHQRLQSLHGRFEKINKWLSRGSARISLESVHEFVSQDDGRMRCHAVKCANIFVRFPNRDLTGIGLVDLPGLGEIATGHSQKLIASLQQEVDAVMVIKMPEPHGAFWDKIDYEVFDCVKSAMPEIELGEWLTVVLNEDLGRNNLDQVALLKGHPPEVGSPVRIISANCRDRHDVDHRVLTVVLDHLGTALQRMDRRYLAALAQQLSAVVADFEGALRPAHEFFQTGPETEEVRVSELSEKFLTEVKQSLETLVDKIRPPAQLGATTVLKSLWERIRKKSKKAGNGDFNSAISEACEAVTASPPIAPIEVLKEQYFAKGGWPAVIQQEMHHLRAHLTHELANKLDARLDEIVNGVLNEILDGLLAPPLDRLLPDGARQNTDPRARIRAFRELLNEKRQSGLISAMDYAASFTFSYQSHFHYRVRMAMDLLDPMSHGGEIAVAGKPVGHAEEIAKMLKNRYLNVISDVQKQFQGELQHDPFRAIFAMAEEMRDRLVRKKGSEKEWQSLLWQRRGDIWPEAYGRYERETERYQEWQETLDRSLQTARNAHDTFAAQPATEVAS